MYSSFTVDKFNSQLLSWVVRIALFIISNVLQFQFNSSCPEILINHSAIRTYFK